MKKRWSSIILCGGSFLLGVGLTLWAERSRAGRTSGLANVQNPANGVTVRTGPWGVLEALEIPLGDSSELFIDRPARLAKTSWFFESYSKEQLETLLRACDLTPAQWQLLQQPGVITIAPNGIMVVPPDELVWTLNPASRAKLYAELAKTGVNYSQYSPFRFSFDRFEERLASAGITPAQQSRISGLSYTNRGFLCFSDLQLLPSFLNTNELDRVSEALYRVPAYRLRLRIMPDSDINGIVTYWGQNGREKLIRPVLESFAKVPGRTNGVTLSISMLMPPTARLRLNTYPSAWPDPAAERQDCFWTALNFFHDPPDSRYLDSQLNKSVLASDYRVINTPPIYGDVVVLLDQAGGGLHACVYIADDFVFTKNGMNRLQPWVLMKMSDMLAYFASENPSRMVVFRRKEPPSSGQDSGTRTRIDLAAGNRKPELLPH